MGIRKMEKTKCIHEWTVDRSNSPFRGMTYSALAEEKSMRIRAVPFIPNEKAMIKTENHSHFKSILKKTSAGDEIVIDEDYFGTLSRVNVSTNNRQKKILLGKVTSKALNTFPPRAILEFLIEKHIIITYAHIGASLCLISEMQTPNEYTAVISGVHTYYTNKKNTGKIHFNFSIDFSTGQMETSNVQE